MSPNVYETIPARFTAMQAQIPMRIEMGWTVLPVGDDGWRLAKAGDWVVLDDQLKAVEVLSDADFHRQYRVPVEPCQLPHVRSYGGSVQPWTNTASNEGQSVGSPALPKAQQPTTTLCRSETWTKRGEALTISCCTLAEGHDGWHAWDARATGTAAPRYLRDPKATD